MIEIIKEASTMLKDLPELAIWILVGILFYKVFIIGGTISLIKFAITKIHSAITREKTVVHDASFGRVRLISGAESKLQTLLLTLYRDRNEKKMRNIGSSYLHEDDIDILYDAYFKHKKDRGEKND